MDQLSYALAMWEDKGWRLIHPRFLIIKTEDSLLGQFITSDWFACECDIKKTQTFLILGVDKKATFSEVESELQDKQWKLKDKRWKKIKETYYFMLKPERMAEYCEQLEKDNETTGKLVLRGNFNDPELTLTGFIKPSAVSKLCFTLPSFSLCLRI